MDGRPIQIRFHGDLRELLWSDAPAGTVTLPPMRRTSLKDLIESLGVPHTEIGSVTVGGVPASPAAAVAAGDCVEVLPRERPLVRDGSVPRFALDVHLGKLTAHLRLLGFDSLYRNDWGDAELARAAAAEQRWLLTRDRQLLMRRVVERGHLIRCDDPLDQGRALLEQFGLLPLARPWSRCLRCNALLEAVEKQEVVEHLQPLTRRYYDRFRRCAGCRAIYWEGSHMSRLRHVLSALGAPADPPGR